MEKTYYEIASDDLIWQWQGVRRVKAGGELRGPTARAAHVSIFPADQNK